MNRVVVSIPRVLDSALTNLCEANCTIDTGTMPATATAPFKVQRIQGAPTETRMTDLTVTPLSDHTNCSRVTATVTLPVTMAITDANGTAFNTNTEISRPLDIILYIPDQSAFPYQITSEAALDCHAQLCEQKTTTLSQVTFKILTRVTAITDLLIPAYGYAPLNPAEPYHASPCQGPQPPLFPNGKIY